MNDKHVLDELSAYIDGESREADRIARHLQFCEACAQRHMELLRVASHLRALPAPQIKEDFAVRVLARVRDETLQEGRWTMRTGVGWAIPSLAMAAAVLIVAALALYRAQPDARVHTPPPMARQVPVTSAQTEAAVMERVEQLVEIGVEESDLELSLDLPHLAAGEFTEPLPIEAIIDEIAVASAAEEYGVTRFGEEDIPEMIQALGPDEFTAFQELLTTYANQG